MRLQWKNFGVANVDWDSSDNERKWEFKLFENQTIKCFKMDQRHPTVSSAGLFFIYFTSCCSSASHYLCKNFKPALWIMVLKDFSFIKYEAIYFNWNRTKKKTFKRVLFSRFFLCLALFAARIEFRLLKIFYQKLFCESTF